MTTAKPIRDSHIKAALTRLNDRNKVVYPNVGYAYFADIKGDVVYRPRVYKIINANGGVAHSTLNGKTKRETVANIDAA